MSKRYKMVFCTQNMAPFRMKWIDELAKEFDVHVYHLNEYAQGVNASYINYIPTRAKVNCVKKKIWKRNFFDIKKIVDEKADVYLLDGYGFIGQLHLIWKLGRKKIPFIISVDGGFIHKEENFIKRAIKAYFMKKANSFLSTSYETDKFIKHYVGNDINIYRHYFSSVHLEDIWTGLNIEKKQVFREELNIEKKFTIVAVGQFIPRKGFDVLIEAIKLLEVDIQVYFIGATDVKLYEKSIDENVKGKIHFVSFCNTSTLDKYYMASDVFVLPTREDVWGLVVGEAMAKGLPVITTNKCLAGVEMIRDGKNGFVVEVENVQELADKILFLYKNPEICIKMSKNNIAVMRKYTIEEATQIDVRNLKDWIENE